MTSTVLDRTGTASGISCGAPYVATLCARIQAEFVEMPGLTVTLPQAMRLWTLTATQSQQLLSDLVDAGFLMRDARGAFRRRGCPRCS